MTSWVEKQEKKHVKTEIKYKNRNESSEDSIDKMPKQSSAPEGHVSEP